MYIICHAPYIFIIFCMWVWFYVPESVRWLQSQGRVEEAMEIVRKIAKTNGKTIPADVTLKGEVVEDKVVRKKANLKDLFVSKDLAVKTLIVAYIWFAVGLLYYGLSLAVDNLGGSLYINYILSSLVEMPANICVVVFCNRFGRKKSLNFSNMIGAVACACVALVPEEGHIKVVRVVLGLVGKFCATIVFHSLYTWTVELFTTRIRSSAMGIMQVSARIGSSSAPFVADGLIRVNRGAPFILMGALSFVSSIIAFKLEETKGKDVDESESPVQTRKANSVKVHPDSAGKKIEKDLAV